MKLTKEEYEELNHYLNTVTDYIEGSCNSSTDERAISRESACYCLGKIDGILSMCVVDKGE